MATRIWIGTDDGNEGDWSVAANWSGAAVPVNGDDVYLENSSQDVSSGLAQGAVVLASLNIAQSYTGKIGVDSDGTYLAIESAIVNIGYHYGPGNPTGPRRVMLNLEVTAAAITVFNTGATYDTGKPTVRLQCNNVATTLEVRKGSVGIAYETGETSSLATITVHYTTNINTDADVFIGSGVTLVTLNTNGGECILGCAVTTVNADAGTLTTVGSGAITTLNVKGATVYCNSTGTITTLDIDSGTVDFWRTTAARTVTTLTLDAGGTLKYDPAYITLTNKIISSDKAVLRAAAA